MTDLTIKLTRIASRAVRKAQAENQKGCFRLRVAHIDKLVYEVNNFRIVMREDIFFGVLVVEFFGEQIAEEFQFHFGELPIDAESGEDKGQYEVTGVAVFCNFAKRICATSPFICRFSLTLRTM